MNRPPIGLARFDRVAAGAVVLAALAVYLPYLKNPLVFDDASFFYGGSFYVAAVAPWEYGLRGLSYFTLAFVEVIFGQMWAHRLVGCVLHAFCAYALFLFVRDLLHDASPQGAASPGAADPRWIALIAALAFTVHPVAVYGAGYLVQRSGLLALLFSLLCLRAFRRGLLDNDVSAILAATAFYVLAVLSKEHALLLPLAAAPLAIAIARLHGVSVARGSAYFLAMCVPVAILILMEKSHFVAAAYEPHLAELRGELFAPPEFASGFQRWLASASTQANLFFKYALLWFWPDTGQMAIDLRVDVGNAPSGVLPWLRLAAFAATGLCGLAVLTCAGRAATVAAFAALYAWSMFLVEMGAVRFQEPFVLYRSYLWAPGYAILFALLLQRVRLRWAIGVAGVTLPLLVLGAYNRLDTFRSSLALWNDAVSALPYAEINGARRIYYNRGRALYMSGRYAEALQDAEMAVRLAPNSAPMRIARGAALLELGRLPEAASDFEAASRLAPDEQRAHILLARTLELLDQPARADETVRRAESLGHRGSLDWLQKFRAQRTGIGASEIPQDRK